MKPKDLDRERSLAYETDIPMERVEIEHVEDVPESKKTITPRGIGQAVKGFKFRRRDDES